MNASPGKLIRASDALVALLRAADTIWNASRLFFSRWDISPSQFNVLNLLRENAAGVSQSELSRQLVMHRSNATGLVDRLEARGLLARKDVEVDRRAYRVVLTARGAALVSEILPHYYAAADRLWAAIPPSRLERLLADLRQTAQTAEQIGAEYPMNPGGEQSPRSKKRHAPSKSSDNQQ